MDKWMDFIGKDVTLMKQTPYDGGLIDTYNHYNPKIAKSRQIKGKVVGTNGSGNFLVMLDKPFSSDVHGHYKSWGNHSNVAIEFRQEVEANRGKNQFIWLNSDQALQWGEKRSEKESKKASGKPAAQTNSVSAEEKPTLFQMMKDDAQDAAFRVASAKIAEGVRNLIVIALQSQLGERASVEAINAVLNTPMGIALIQAMSGYALTYAPKKISNDPRVKRLAKEFRVAGMATAGGVAVDTILPQLTSLVEGALEMLPGAAAEQDSKVRVTQDAPNRSNVIELAQAEEEESEEEESSKRRMSANGSRG